MWAHMDWHCEHAGITRVFEDNKEFEVDDYMYAIPFVVHERFEVPDEDGFIGIIEYIGVCVRAPTLSEYRAIRNVTHKAMYRGLSTRVKNTQKRTIEVCQRHARNNKE